MPNTICAIATATGGAIGIIRVSGSDAITITNSIFSRDILNAPANTVVYGTIRDNSEETPVVIDEVLVTIFRAPHSYTGEDSVEISCHGSSYILQKISQLLISNGCQQAAPGEFTQRAFLNGKIDLSQAEAVADLISSQNVSQHRVAMAQLRGGISTRLSELRKELLHLTSLLELELDFSEHEELEFADRSELLSIAQQIKNEISRLSSSFEQGNAIKNGIPVAIIGAPNVGKSTLLNQLLQEDKAIVSDIQGTTRDTIEDTITIGGICFRLIDTAGLRHTEDKIESLGIERSIKAAERAQVILLMRDDVNDYPALPLREDQRVIRIHNKSSHFQAKNGIGMEWLKQELVNCAPSQSDSAVLITNIRHKQALDQAYNDILRSIEALNQSLSGDLIAEDLRLCLSHLAEIVGGEITPNEVLSNIFKHFCIGK